MKAILAITLSCLGMVQILYFKDKTVVIYGPQDNVQIQIGSPAAISSIPVELEPPAPSLDFYRLPTSSVYHKPDCRIVVTRTDRMKVLQSELLSLRPCLICNPSLPKE